MRDLIKEEIHAVSGGDVICTIGTVTASCTSPLDPQSNIIFIAYEQAVRSLTNFFEWIDEQFDEDNGD